MSLIRLIEPEAPVTGPPAVPVTVVPIPAKASKTLRSIKLAAIWSAIVAAFPTVLSYLLELLNYPGAAEVIAQYVPAEVRILFVVAAGIYLRGSWRLRMVTTEPIIGSPGEAKAQEIEKSL